MQKSEFLNAPLQIVFLKKITVRECTKRERFGRIKARTSDYIVGLNCFFRVFVVFLNLSTVIMQNAFTTREKRRKF